MSRKRKFEDELMIATTAILVSVAAVVPEPPIPKHVSILTGKDYFQELLDSENEISFRDPARMDKMTFHGLLNLLMIEGGLRNGSKKICAGEKLLIFIQVLKGPSLRSIGDRFQCNYSRSI
jgi:hypothetical protein